MRAHEIFATRVEMTVISPCGPWICARPVMARYPATRPERLPRRA